MVKSRKNGGIGMKDSFIINNNTDFSFDPAVFVYEEGYYIIFVTPQKGIGWVEIDGAEYLEKTVGGLIQSEKLVHKILVPHEVLDKSQKYTVCFAAVAARLPYFPKTSPIQSKTFSFKSPAGKKDLNVYHLCDTHTRITPPARACEYFGDELDLIIMNGDIPNHSGSVEMLTKIHELCEKTAHGSIPIVFSRGNHDTRGEAALDFIDYTPNKDGDFFYTVRFSNVWAVILDCGEDKPDSNVEYGGMICFEPYRKKQTEFLKKLNETKPYLAPGIDHRIAICHIPLYSSWNLFAKDIYAQWLDELNAMGLDLMLCGHDHQTLYHPDGKDTGFGKMDFPIIIGGTMASHNDYHGTALKFTSDSISFEFTDSDKNVLEKGKIK